MSEGPDTQLRERRRLLRFALFKVGHHCAVHSVVQRHGRSRHGQASRSAQGAFMCVFGRGRLGKFDRMVRRICTNAEPYFKKDR